MGARKVARETINPALRRLAVPIAGLRPDPENARKHDERNLNAVVESLHRIGQQKPIVVVRGMVVRGHATLLAAKKLNWRRIAAVQFDSTLEMARAFGIADNRTAELSTWHKGTLAAMLKAIAGDELLAVSGFTDEEFMGVVDAAEGTLAPADTPDGKGAKAPRTEAAQPSSDTRVAQLFLNAKTEPRFKEMERKLRGKYKTKAVADTVLAAVEKMAARHGRRAA